MAKRHGRAYRLLAWYWGKRDEGDRGEPVKRTIVAVVLLLVGIGGSELYAYGRDKFRDPDAYLVQMKKDQDASFARLQDSLGALGHAVDGNGRAALSEVRTAVAGIEKANEGLLLQLELAKQENNRLSLVAKQQSGVSGGYDVLLTENTGMPLDGSAVLGVQRISLAGATVSVTGAGDGDSRFLRSGESIAYTGDRGAKCRVTLLSIGGGGNSASFDQKCN